MFKVSNIKVEEDHSYPNWLVQGFHKVIEDCGLIDIDMEGCPFTWERVRGSTHWIEIRLNRAFVTESLLCLLCEAKLINTKVCITDHCPLLLAPAPKPRPSPSKPFRFKN